MTDLNKPRLALVFCVHHKPWLIQSTLISAAMQHYQDFDMIFLIQEGDGRKVQRETFRDLYEEYYFLAHKLGVNEHLDPFQPEVLEACKIGRSRLQFVHLENDHSLDSGAWLKFIQKGLWKSYDYIWFIGEGSILARDSTVEDSLGFMRKTKAHFLTTAHQKRRIPKKTYMENLFPTQHRPVLKPMYEFHQRMIHKSFEIFRRDPQFETVFNAWGSDFKFETQNHVPDVFGPKAAWLRLYGLFYPRLEPENTPHLRHQIQSTLSKFSPAFATFDKLASTLHFYLSPTGSREQHAVYVNQARKTRAQVVNTQKFGKTNFHEETGPEWFGCSCTHLVSREFLTKLDSKLRQFNMYEILDLPYSASALEIIWGMIPAWLGWPKYFHDGIHRVVKHFRNLRREDDAAGMCRYLNRYYAGRLVVTTTPHQPFLKIQHSRPSPQKLSRVLNPKYF